jgi:predicted amidohydrolase YtcJ
MPTRAQLLFAGGPVYTADASGRRIVAATCDDGSPATAVAVAGGRIAAIGAPGDRDIRDLTGPATDIVDLHGRALLPGFQDAHVHPAFAGVTMLGCNLIGATTLDEALARIAGYARQHPDRSWIAGSGWRMEWFPGGTPDRHTLDSVTQGRPAYLSNRDGHGAWASTRALELAGISARTPDPADGRIVREADGAPQGTLHEGAADLVGRLVPPLTVEERLAGLLLAQQHLHARGVTAWQDAIVGEYLGGADPLPVYLAAAASGELTARVQGALWWDRGRGEEQLPEILSRRERARGLSWPGQRFRAETVKIMQDGVAENFTAAMIDPTSSRAAAISTAPACPTSTRTRCRALSRGSMRSASRSISMPSATGLRARRWMRSRQRAPQMAGLTTGTTSRTCGFCTQMTCPGLRRST